MGSSTTDTTKVLYIAGWGRSGSTIIDNILGEIDGFFSGGEIHYLWERGLIEGRSCGCGLPLGECEMWSQVLALLGSKGIGADSASEIVRWQEQCVRIRHTFGLARSRARRRDGVLEAYARVLGEVYSAVRQVTGARVIIDSSKRPSDGAMLRLVPGVSPSYVHLVRDPRAVSYSWRRRKAHLDRAAAAEMRQHNVVGSTASWTLWNLAIETLRRRHDSSGSMLLRYEDFIVRPRATIEAIVELVGEDPAQLPFEDDATVRLSGNHTISGNPSRFSTGQVALRADDEWMSNQSPTDRALATVLALPLLRRYGYPRRPRSSASTVSSRSSGSGG
ncbi:MAG TPA: sulfotransferase [Acidimicrobiia bacterium]|nr:sulfotransferase [Acidimicrobiia bacterium]